MPTNGQSLDATPLLANIVALAQAIAAFDGSQINAGSVLASALAASANPNTLLAAITSPFVSSGVVWTIVSGLSGTMSGGTIYYNGTPVTINSVASHTFTASQDTYIDVDKNGNVTYQGVSNGSTSPSLTANSIRVAKVITSGSAITSIVLIGSDSLGNIIYPHGGLTPVQTQNPYKFSVYRNAAANTGNGAFALLACDTKEFDTGSNVDVVTNKGRFTAPVAGFYHFDMQVNTAAGSGANHAIVAAFYKNGSEVKQGSSGNTENAAGNAVVSCLLQLAANDYIEPFVYGDVTLALSVGFSLYNYFSGFLVSAT